MTIALEEDHFYYAGRMIAISLVHGGPAPRFLSPVLFEALVWGPEKTKVPVELVPDEAVREALIKVCNIGYCYPYFQCFDWY